MILLSTLYELKSLNKYFFVKKDKLVRILFIELKRRLDEYDQFENSFKTH